MRTTVFALLLVATIACSGGSDGSGGRSDFLPDATVVGNEASCYECALDIDLLSDLAEARDKDAITGDFRSLLQTGAGIAITSNVPGPPLLFGFDGRLIRPITGDKESDRFANATLMRYGWGDSILVLDEFARRIAVLSPALKAVRFIPVQVPVSDMLVMADGDLLLVSPRTIGDSTNPIMRVSGADGASMPPPATSFPNNRRADAAYASRVITLSRDGSYFWSAHTLRYAIEKRTLDGEVVQILERDVSWFPPSESIAAVSPESVPTPRVVGIWEDVRGLLWIETITADHRWPTAIGSLQGVDGKSRYFVLSKDLYYDTRIEIIDPQTGQLVATAKFDSELPTFTPGTLVSRVVNGPSGWLVGEVWSVRFTGWHGRQTGQE